MIDDKFNSWLSSMPVGFLDYLYTVYELNSLLASGVVKIKPINKPSLKDSNLYKPLSKRERDAINKLSTALVKSFNNKDGYKFKLDN